MASGYRRDITGLRTLAVVLVLLYHAGVPGFAGGFVGVDVFFVVSGYLITGLLVRELDEHGRINLWQFYARRARRLLPASFTVLAFVASIVYLAPRWLPQLVLPQLFGRSVSWDIQRSSLYIVNWLFVERSVSYQGSDDFGSPVLHFWSLAVEEQFYAVWPVLVVAVGLVTARSKVALGVVIGIVTVASLIHSWQFTNASPAEAYFVTTTRVWEMALGGLLALVTPPAIAWLQARPTHAANQVILATTLPLSVLAIIYATTQFSAATAYPGTAALVPTLAGAAILFVGALAQATDARPFGGGALEVTPVQWLGERSYSIYLWHWPLLWLATSVWGSLGWSISVLVAAASILPAAASYRFIEVPVRHGARFSRPVMSLGAAGVMTVAGYAMGALLLLTTTNVSRSEVVVEPITTEVAGIQVEAGAIQPPLGELLQDDAVGNGNGCFVPFRERGYWTCEVGSPSGSVTVIAVGNSHLGHWAAALDEIAARRDWRLVYVQHNGCRLDGYGAPPQCVEWLDTMYASLGALVDDTNADLIVTSSPQIDSARSGDQAESAYTEAYASLASHGAPLAVIAPVPTGKAIGIDCSQARGVGGSSCDVDRTGALSGAMPITNAAAAAGASVIDMTDYFCDSSTCPAVIDNIWVRRDDNHITRTYSQALNEVLEEQFMTSLPTVFGARE